MRPMQGYLIHNDIMGATIYGSSVHKGRKNFLIPIQNRDRGLVSSSSSVSTARRFQKPLAPAYPPSSLRRAHRRGGPPPSLAAPFPIEAASSLIPRWLVPQNETSNETNESSPEQLDPLSPSSSAKKDEITQQKPILSIGGGGRYFFWYLGVIKYMQEVFDFNKVSIYGASAGALIAVLAASGVNLDRAVREAYRVGDDNQIWTRPGGLAGIWGSLVRQWLDELLPPDAAERCRGRVKLVATEAPTFRLCYLEDFASREDLIDAAMASVHIPFFLDGNPTRQYRGKRFVDGSLWDFITGSNSKLLTCGGNAFVVDYFNDEQLEYQRLDFIKLTTYDEVKDLVRAGYAYARRADDRGEFEPTLGPARKTLLTRVVEFPARQIGRAFAVA